MRRNPMSIVAMSLLADPPVPGEGYLPREGLATFMRPDEDDHDFVSDVFSLARTPDKELHDAWRVFTSLAGKEEGHNSRRLENAAWRLEAMRKAGRLDGNSASSNDLQSLLLASASPELAGVEAKAADPSQAFSSPPSSPDRHTKPSTGVSASSILSLCVRHGWSDDCLDDVLACIDTPGFNPDHLPSSAALLRSMPTNGKGGSLPQHKIRPICGLFTHSLQRNGANNFCFYLVSRLRITQRFVVFSPSEGPMSADFEALGCKVHIVDTKAAGFIQKFGEQLVALKVGLLLANTIMRSDVVTLASQMSLPTVWVIHESWPQDKLEYYAQEVFMRKDLTAAIIKGAFAKTDCVVFPSEMQKNIYKGLFRPGVAATVYNGIPLQKLDRYQREMDRAAVRSALGYGADDFVVLHIGTICGRKGQIYTAKAASALMSSGSVPNMKVLMVGARYIRDHEIAYIDHIKETITSAGLSWARYEDTPVDQRGVAPFTIMDIQSSVLRFYMAADVVLVPSLNEVLPLVIGEAMAFRKPIICSRIDAIPEAVTHETEGFLIPPADADALGAAIKRVYDSPALAKRLGDAGRNRVERQFSYAFMCLRYRELMDVVASRHGNPAMPTVREVFAKSPATSPLPPAAPKAIAPIMSPLLPAAGATAASGHSGETKSGSDDATVRQLAGRTVLVDMDNTLVDWDKEFIRRLCQSTGMPGQRVARLVGSRKHYEIEKNDFGVSAEKMLGVIKEAGFYAALQPFPGAVDALQRMVAAGVDVRLVTSPHPECAASCAAEKYQWLLAHLGHTWIDRLIIARDKTHVQGDVLVDDKPKISGSSKVVRWTQVLYSQSYNKTVDLGGRKRLGDWVGDWASVLLSSLPDASE